MSCGPGRRLPQGGQAGSIALDQQRIVVDVGGLHDPDIGTVDALARLQLAALRSGRRLVLCHAPAGLRALLVLAGLEEALPCEPDPGYASRRGGSPNSGK